MNERNFEYLKDNIKYLGFGENLNEPLLNELQFGDTAFSLVCKTEINKKSVEAILNFRKSEASDMYFFNSYQVTLQRTNGQKMDYTFYLVKGKGITLKEAYNLLEGRAVYKELFNKKGEPYNAWLQIDFDRKDKHDNYVMKQFHSNYGYDLKVAVSKFPIAELNDPEKEKKLLHSLNKGNVQAVQIEKNDSYHQMFIAANPKYKTVNLFDRNMKLVSNKEIGEYKCETIALETKMAQEPSLLLKKKNLHSKRKDRNSNYNSNGLKRKSRGI